MAGTNIKRNLPNDEYNAAVNANSPSAANPFATIADASNIYVADGTIATTRVATIQNGLTWSGSTETRITNTRTIKEVISAADIGTTLAANTTYVIIGKVTLTQTIQVVNVGSEVVGLNRDVDEIEWRGGGNLFDIRDQNFSISNLKISSDTPGNNIIAGTNVGAGYNFARNKVLTLLNCQFRGTYDVMDINGFDLVDIHNCLFFYIKATNWGLRFRDTSKIEITSCELIRWFDETNLANSLGAWSAGSYVIGDIVTDGPTFYKALTNNSVQPSTSIGVDWDATGYATIGMIDLRNNNLASFGAVNINSCILHPQQTQNGINIGTASTTGFGTISSNAFVNVGLTTGKVFLPEVSSLPDYSSTATQNYDIFANQGLLNSTSGCVGTLSNNTTPTNTAAGIQDVNTGGSAATQASVRFTVGTNGVARYDGTKQVYCSIHASVTIDSTGNDGTYQLSLWKDSGSGYVLLPGSEVEQQFDGTGGLSLDVGTVAINYGTLFNNTDRVVLRIQKVVGTASDCTVMDFQLVIRE